MDKLIKYDVIVPVTEKTLPFFSQYVIPFIKKNIIYKKIIVIGDGKLKTYVNNTDCSFFDENHVLNNMNLATISKIINSRQGKISRSGWYFQQFIKMAWANIAQEQYYLVWDSDTIPLRPLLFFDNNIILYNEKNEFHLPYFQTIDILFNGTIKKNIEGSFIAEHMLIDKFIMKKMISEIESNSLVPGNSFWEKILYAIPTEHLSHSGFSEFETYGNFAIQYAKELYAPRFLKSLRSGLVFLGKNPSQSLLKYAASSYHIVSIEHPSQPIETLSIYIPSITSICQILHIKLKYLVRLFFTIRNLYYFLKRKSKPFYIE